MIFFLSFLAGFFVADLLAVLVVVLVSRYQHPIQRTLNQIENKFKEKGEIFTPDENVEDLKEWVSKLPNE